MSDNQFIQEWVQRHDWSGSLSSAKAAIDDAASNPEALARVETLERENAAMREAIKEAHDDAEQTVRLVAAFVHRIRGGGRIHPKMWLKDAEDQLHNAKATLSKLQPFLKP